MEEGVDSPPTSKKRPRRPDDHQNGSGLGGGGDDCGLCILNDGSSTTVNYPRHNPSAIDVSFISPQLAPFCEWSVYDDAMGSYHYPTITNITINPERYTVIYGTEKFLYNKTDWNKYAEVSNNVFQDMIVSKENPVASYEEFCNRLNKLKQMCVPKFTKTNFRGRPPAPWWNSTCEEAVIKSYNALKLYRNDPTVDNYINYKRLDALKKRTIKEQKRISWNSYCNSFNRTTPISQIWNLIKKFKGVRTGNKSYRDDFVQPFLDKLSDNTNLVNSNSLNDYFISNNENPQSRFLLEPFSWSEFIMSLQSRKNTSPGLDDFPYLLITYLPESIKLIFLNVLNSLWHKKLIPTSWKTQCVIPILKPDKSPENASSYRPISLSSCLGKIFENMLKTRLDWYAESNTIIPHIQYGFRKGRSCADSFISLTNDLKNAKNNKIHTVCVFLDVQGAFDSVDPGILVKVLSNAGIPGQLCKWIYDFLSNRVLYVRHNNVLHGPRIASKGTMQGATLSPLLYNLYTCEICKYVDTKNVNILQFADDLVLYSSDLNLTLAVEKVNTGLRQLNNYYQHRLNLKVNTMKSNVMIFGKDLPMINVTYNGDVIQQVSETSGKQDFNHPKFKDIVILLDEYNGIKYTAYKVAFKIFVLQKQLKVPPLRISSGVFARHQLSLSESSLSLDTAELEAVLADIYFAAEKEGLFDGDIDLAVDLVINLLLNVYDENRNTPIRVLAAKTLLIILSEESVDDKWFALANCCADHNGCVSPRRLSALLQHVAVLAKYLGGPGDQVQSDVDGCFSKSAGMLGVSCRSVADWGVNTCCSTNWLIVVQRVVSSRNCSTANASCVVCLQPLIQVLKFKCAKCTDLYFCEKCYLYDKDLNNITGHKKSHLVYEVNDGQIKPTECLSFMKGMKRFFFCTKTGKKSSKKGSKKKKERPGSVRRKQDEKPAIFTSTVGKASGHKRNNPAITLEDIITQLENQTRALKDISSQLQEVSQTCDDELKTKVDTHYNQISAQISRLRELKENLTSEGKTEKSERPQAFDMFSPIPVDEKQAKMTENLKNQPRVLSMDSGNFSVTSKHENQVLSMTGDALKPVIQGTSDSISAVSMNEMTNWYNETGAEKRSRTILPDQTCHNITTEQRFAADMRSVEQSNDKMKELNADLDTVLDRLQQILTHNFTVDESCFDNSQLKETANEMEGLLGSLIRGVEQRATLNTKGMV
ncbi:unnamed protein product [Leptosia nina]|uniref:Reverse transcriptase domain-containing protein n=1 Tax=Leptosia nina TaxID=320188 RepID=A0AAV1JWP2_9NEOP